MTAHLPKQDQLFADGAIDSQPMQVSHGDNDGHRGEWMMDPALFARSFRLHWEHG